ncbi:MULTISPECIES: LysR family transcriptional regulator [Paraburkholderia]|uniref:LysR family transcriptional regulator n=1 Tax=Paraburkholderia metrosideri TaxID=580937 RepID=A0ABW9E3J7_9BURK
MTDLRQLRQFVVVAEELHFRRAAARLHMTQPPLTQAMRGLEYSLEIPLFDRTKKKVALTPAGEALLEYARRLLRASDELPGLVKAAANGQTGRLRLAFVSTVAYGRVPGWMSHFRQLNPDVSLELHEATLDVQLASLEADEVDAGFILHALGAVPVGFSALQVLVEPFLVALPANHIAATKSVLRFADIAADPIVIFPRTVVPSLFDALLSYYHLSGVTPRIAQEAIEMQTIVSLVAAGMGIAWVPQVFARFPRPGVVYHLVEDMNVPIETSLIWLKQNMPIFDRFVIHIKESPNFMPPIFDPVV